MVEHLRHHKSNRHVNTEKRSKTSQFKVHGEKAELKLK